MLLSSNLLVEHRIYTIKLRKMLEFLEVIDGRVIPILRETLGSPLGFYVSNVGPLNQFVHLWAYDNPADYARRCTVRNTHPDFPAFHCGPSIHPGLNGHRVVAIGSDDVDGYRGMPLRYVTSWRLVPSLPRFVALCFVYEAPGSWPQQDGSTAASLSRRLSGVTMFHSIHCLCREHFPSLRPGCD